MTGQVEDTPVTGHYRQSVQSPGADDRPPAEDDPVAPLPLEELVRMLDHLPGMVAFWDSQGRNRFANRGHAEYFGMTPEEIRGADLRRLMGEEVYERSRPYIEGVLAGEPQHFERTMTDASGRTRYMQVAYIPNLVEGTPSGFFVLASDITARMQAERALEESVRQLALLEERQRIAADLHDLVIQRLFAAGLDLAAVQRKVPDPETRIASAAIGIDEGIRELRRAIHSLRELMTPTQLPATIERILGNSARVLGFVPTMTYTGALDALPESAVQDLLAVLNEALSNVARHAAATEVSVTLACSPEHVLLRVTDNGRGLTSTQRSSGLTNLRRRAEKHGGTFACRPHQPSGTVVEWMVPVAGG